MRQLRSIMDLTGLTLEEQYGPFESWTSDDRAVVIHTDQRKIVKRFRGESAWSNANRYAYDLYTAAVNA